MGDFSFLRAGSSLFLRFLPPFEAAALLGVIKIARRGRRNRCTTECLCCKHVPSKRERSISRSLPGRWGLEVAWLFAWWS